MDELHAVALEEIALEGKRGCALSLLWQLLDSRLPAGIPSLSLPLKQHLWLLLRSNSSYLTYSTEELQAQAREAAKQAGPAKKKKKKKKGEEEEEEQPQIVTEIPFEGVPESFSEAEESGIVLVAPEAARLAVVGVHDELEANHKLSEHQLAVLEMVGQRRHHGAVQTDMANELGVQHRNFFYVLKMLEARHMIVRNKLMVPMPNTANNSGWSTTSIVHLPRYAPRVVLGAEAVFKEVKTAQGQQLQQQAVQQQGQSSGSYVVRDDATVMQQICEFVGSQNGHYVSESQVKAMLGFTGSATAHRQWRRLRTRLIKLGCIVAELGMVGEKAISVLRLVKPYKLRLPVVVNSDDDQDEAGAGDEGDEADGPADKAAADEAEQEAEGEEGGEGGTAAGGGGASKLPVEVGREQLMLEIICEAGDEGVLTPELSKRLGVAPKLLLRAVPELCKKYGVKVEYDMPNKALTNRLIAPQHLLDKHKQQRHLLGMTQPAAAAASSLQGAGSTAQQQLLPPSQQQASSAAVAGQAQQTSAAAEPAKSAGDGSFAPAQAQSAQQSTQEQAATTSTTGRPAGASASKGKKRTAAPAAGRPQPAAAEEPAAVSASDTDQQQQQPVATEAAAGDGGAADAMDVDAPAAAAATEAVLRQAAGPPADSAAVDGTAAVQPTAVGQELEVDSCHAAAAATQPVTAGGQALRAAGGAAGGLRPAGKRLAGLSTHTNAAHALGSTAAALARGALYRVQAVTAVSVRPGAQPAVSGDQQAKSSAQPAEAAAAGAGGFGYWGQGNLSRLQQRRLQVLNERLQDTGFLMKQELRRLIMNAEIQPATNQKPHNLYDSGPDTKTCNRLIGLLIDSGAAKAVKLQYHQEAVLEPKEVEVFLRADIEQTPELLQRIAVYDAELPGNLRREGMRRALLAQGLVGRAAEVAAEAADAEAAGASKNAFAGLGLRVASEHVQMLPVASNLRSLPGYGIRAAAAAAAAAGGASRGRPRGTGRRPRKQATAAGDNSGAATAPAAADSGGRGKVPAAQEVSAGAAAQQPSAFRRPVKGQEIQQLHHNGYIPSLMLRAKLLHQYLCTCVNLKVEPHDDIPEQIASSSSGQTSATLNSAGFAASDRSGAAMRLHFVLADGAQEQQQGGLLQQEGLGGEGGDEGSQPGELFQLSRPVRAAAETALTGAASAAAEEAVAAHGGAAEDGVAAAEIEGSQQQREVLEQQLGGRLLSVSQLWLNMPLAVALSVGGTSLRIRNLLQLVCDTTAPPRIGSFDTSDLDTVFGDKAWKRLVTGLAVLTKLKLVTAARRGGPSSEQIWTQCHPTKATHLVVGTLGVLDEPIQAAEVAPARLDFDFTQAGKWGEYWTKMQSLYDTPLFSLVQLQQFFPASSVPDVARHRCWATYRDMSLVPFLRLRGRLDGLPVEQLDMHMARQVAEELGMTYPQVHQFVTRLRTEINEQRQKAGLERIYLLNKPPEGTTAAAEAASRRKRASATSQRKAEREKRRRKHEKRRLKRLRQQEQGGSSLAGSGTTGIPSGSESDSESEEDSEVDSAELAAATAAADETDATTGAAGLPPRPPKRKSKSKKAKWQQQGSAAAGGSGLSLSGSDSDVSSGDGRQQHREASTIGRQLPKILIEVVPADAAEAAIAGAAAGQDGGSDGWDSDGGGRKTRSSLQGVSGAAAGIDGGVAGSAGGAVRIAGKRHRWTPQQDRQLLRWVVQQRVELGTRGQVRWSHAAPGLPLRVGLCTRRFNFLKKNKSSSKFIASLEAQATEIHKDFSSRRIALQQHLSRLQQDNKLSVNPVSLAQRQNLSASIAATIEGAAGAEGQQQQQQQQQQWQQQGSQLSLLLSADYEPPLAPLPGGQQQQQQSQDTTEGTAAAAAAAGGPGTAAAWLSAAGPHKVTAQGNIVLLPDELVTSKYERLLEQIEEFVTPRMQQRMVNRERRSAAGDRAGGDDGPPGLKQQRRRRRQEMAGDFDQGEYEDDAALGDSDAGISSGDSEGEDEWALLTNAAGAGAAAAGQKRRSGHKRRGGSRQVRPLKTVADRVAHSAALLAAAAAAAAAVIAQRRAAGEQIDQVEEERERQLQLQAYIEGSRKRRGKQRKQPHGSAIVNPRDLIQSWRRHHAGVETRPAVAKAQQEGAAAANGQKPAEGDTEMLAAAVEESPHATSREITPAAEVHAGLEVSAAAAAAGPDAATEVDAPGAAAAAAVAAWPYGPAPSVPVVCAMHLITSLLHLVAEAGSLPADASLALLLRFSQAEVAAAFRWLRALGWLNSGAARRPFQLSSTWNKRLRGEGVLADLMDRAPAALLALRRLGLLCRQDSSRGPASTRERQAEVQQGTAGAVTVPAADAVSDADADTVSGQLLAGLQQVEQDKARAAAAKEKQKQKATQQQQQQRVEKTGAAVDGAVHEGKHQQQQQQQDESVKVADSGADAMDVDGQEGQQQKQQHEQGSPDGSNDQTAVAAPAKGVDAAAASVEPAAVADTAGDSAATDTDEARTAAAAAARADDPPLPSTPKAVDHCLSVLHPAIESNDSTSFWVGLQPSAAAAVAPTPALSAAKPAVTRPKPVPGGLLLEVIISAATGQVQLRLLPVAQSSTSGRGAARGEAAALSQKPPQLLVQLAAATAATADPATAAGDGEEGGVMAVDIESKASSSAGRKMLLIPSSAGGAGDAAAPSSASLMAYCCDAAAGAVNSLDTAPPGTPSQAGEAALASRKRLREVRAVKSEEDQEYTAVDVGGDAALRQQAEAACLAAAAVDKEAGAETADALGSGARPCKKQRCTGDEQAISQESRVHGKCHPDLVRALLLAVRSAGSLGLSTAELVQHWRQPSAPGSVAPVDSAAQPGEVDALDTLPAATNATTEAQEQEAGSPAADATKPANQDKAAAVPQESESVDAFATLPEALQNAPAADAAALVSNCMALLQRYGLARRVPGWQQCVWVSAEGSQRLLAWPLPHQADQQQQGELQQQQQELKKQQKKPEEQQEQQQQQQQQWGDAAAGKDAKLQGAGATGNSGAATEPAGARAVSSSAVLAAKDGIIKQQQQQGSSSIQSELLVAPWLDHKGCLNPRLWQSLVKRIMGVVLRNPGIPEPLLVGQLDVISPAAAKEALRILVQGKHLIQIAVPVPRKLGAGDLQGASPAGGADANIPGGSSSSDNGAAKKISSSAGSPGYSGWGGGAVALRLGAGLTNCTPTPAKPPSLLTGRTVTIDTPAGGGVSVSERQVVKDELVEVLHYWPSLTTSTTCHLTCLPLGCRGM